jgi:hypothetical protein
MNKVSSANLRVGDWMYDGRTLVVRYREGTHKYEVDLEKCTTCAELLDWIFQFRKKGWATSRGVGGLVEILNRLLHPQRNLCSFGKERGLLPKGDALRSLIANRIKQ